MYSVNTIQAEILLLLGNSINLYAKKRLLKRLWKSSGFSNDHNFEIFEISNVDFHTIRHEREIC